MAGLLEPGRCSSPGGGSADAVLLVLVLLPAGADAEQEPTAAELVDGGRPVGEHRGVPVGVAEHEGAEAQPLGGHGEGGERRGALEGRRLHRAGRADVAHEVVHDVHAVPAGGLGVAA